MKRRFASLASICVAVTALGGCGGTQISSGSSLATQSITTKTGTPIQHIVLIVQENRSFNNFFATFPGATGTTTGEELVGKGTTAHDQAITLKQIPLVPDTDLNHMYPAFHTAYDGGKMDAFNQIIAISNGKTEKAQPYVYVNPADIAPYWAMATNYDLADHMFQTQGSGSFTAHQDLIRGGTAITKTESLIDDPTSSKAWGCTSPLGTKTSLITTALKLEPNVGPFPCTSKFPNSNDYNTLQTSLDAQSISWKYYTPAPVNGTTGALWNAFLVIDAVWGNQNEWNAHISSPQTNILSDITNGQLASMSWVIPDAGDSDHPGYAKDDGPEWVSSIVNAIGQSQYWNSTAIIVTWDDWGGFYDPVSPGKLDKHGGPGFRVPMIVISAYGVETSASNPGYVSHTVYQFGSIIRFIEQTFSLPTLGTTDQTSNSMQDMFDYTQTPRGFVAIPSKLPMSHFLHEKPSGWPVDTY